MNKEFTGKSSLTSFCAESSEKNFNGLPGNKGHSNTAGGKSGAAYQRDWYFNRRKCCHGDAHLAAAHRLPDTKNVKHQLIVKFVHRVKREEMYKKYRNPIVKEYYQLAVCTSHNGSRCYKQQ